MRLTVTAALFACLLSGCSGRAHQPQWLADLNQIACKAGANAECLLRVADEHLLKASASPFLLTGTLHFVAAAELKGRPWTPPVTLNGNQTEIVKDFAKSVRYARDGKGTEAVDAANAVRNSEARLLALFYVATTASVADSQASDNALSALLRSAPDLYARAMQQRLEAMLLKGDIERALALRNHLVDAVSTGPNSVSDINDLALVYSRTGMIGDMQDWLRRLAIASPELNEGDEGRLRSFMIDAALGSPPAPDELAKLDRQENTLVAYQELAKLYRLLGNNALERKAIQDAALFCQMTNFLLDPALAAEHLSVMLLASSSL